MKNLRTQILEQWRKKSDWFKLNFGFVFHQTNYIDTPSHAPRLVHMGETMPFPHLDSSVFSGGETYQDTPVVSVSTAISSTKASGWQYPILAILISLGLFGVYYLLNKPDVTEAKINEVRQKMATGNWKDTDVKVIAAKNLTEMAQQQVTTRVSTLNLFFNGIHDDPTVISQLVFNGDKNAMATVYSEDGQKLYAKSAYEYLNKLDTLTQKAIINCKVTELDDQIFLKDINVLELPITK